jgi:hypothetical protein
MKPTRNGEKGQGKSQEGSIEIMGPGYNYYGKSYSEFAADWFNWFISAQADKRNSGSVVFMRSKTIPLNIPGRITETETLHDPHSIDRNYPTGYRNDPNIRIDGDRLQIFADQYVFVPIIIAYKLATDPYMDWGYLQDYVGLIIDSGDNPPDRSQLEIYETTDQSLKDISKGIKWPERVEMKQFRITTPIFTAIVPEAPIGTSTKDFLEEGSIAPGNYQAMVDGYFIMLKFPEPQAASKTYYVHAWASAGREPKGPYFSELLYEVEVFRNGGGHGVITRKYPARNEEIINYLVTEKAKITQEIRQVRPGPSTLDNIKTIRQATLSSIKAIKRDRPDEENNKTPRTP